MKKKTIVILSIAAVLLLAVVIGGLTAYNNISASLAGLKDLPITDADLSKVSDGTYPGSYSAFPSPPR